MTRILGRVALIVGFAGSSAAPAAPAAPQATLRDARIRIGVSGDTARVSARYRVTGAGDSLRFNAIRIAGQDAVFRRPFANPRLRLDTLPGLFRLTAAGRSPGLSLELQYDELVRQIGRTTERDIVIEREQNVHDYEEDEDLDEGRPFPEEGE